MGLVKRSFLTVCAFVFVLTVVSAQGNDTNILVNTSKGIVQGFNIESKATAGKYMRVFRGIPFAKPPVNELRFLDPVPADNWITTKTLPTANPSPCPQFVPSIFDTYKEDCLYVNVYTPQLHQNLSAVTFNSRLPVLVWIYGGAFQAGSSSSDFFGPDFLVDQEVIFVSFNYRVGALGFLNLGTDSVPGNAGLKDQLLALQWVQTEISHFGGDPNKVTLFGESAGAASVILQYLSPRSENLFRYAIADSGNGLAEWCFLESGFLERAKMLSDSLSCTINNTVNLTCLQKVNVSDIVAVQNLNLSDNLTIPGNGLPFIPSLEKSNNASILSDTPLNLLKTLATSNRAKRPLITGVNKDEGILLLKANENFYKNLYSKLQYFIPEVRRKKLSEAEIEKYVASIKTKYFNNTEPSLENFTGVINIYTDKLFATSTARFARYLAKTTTVYLYHFDYYGGFSPQRSSVVVGKYNGVNHGDELSYIFSSINSNQSATNENSTDMLTMRKMIKMWTNFVKTGNPTPNTTNGTAATETPLGNFQWSPIKDGSYPYLRVTENLTLSSDNFEESTVVFWNQIEAFSFGIRQSSSFLLIFCVFVLTWFSH